MAFSARSSATAAGVEVGRVDGLALFGPEGLDGGGECADLQPQGLERRRVPDGCLGAWWGQGKQLADDDPCWRWTPRRTSGRARPPPSPRHPAAELERPAPTARRVAEASISPNTRRTYSGAPPGSTAGRLRTPPSPPTSPNSTTADLEL